ncbi:Na/Pi symporter [Texcoconibacillus texcoconensis]|uniref:Phosphate:Na+ symporter n=1 Tax=Texcoconibacillus texcoconensis TaxID=1095777 RepID=A0A840QR59_9BACI|nr:Na/Pi symporter [Texcoconibacillus texcoconensis]MBB5173946.1 phosphate:Na+ symporter [Texcoconibacillus texcoconensis]
MNELFSQFVIFLSIFLFGMFVMRQGLVNMQEHHASKWLEQLVDKPWKGLLVGTIVTSLLQSSSAVIIISVGLVAAKMIPFSGAVGVILGANIGTSVTLEILAVDFTFFIIPLLLIGVPLLFFQRRAFFCLGCVCFGLASIFIAMKGFESLAAPLSSLHTIYDALAMTKESHLLGISVGALVTAVIQSSTATTAVAMSFVNEHLFTLQTGVAIMLGANIGTCITVWLATIGGTIDMKRVAYAHIWVNIFGAVLFFPFIEVFSDWIAQTSSSPSQQLAHASLVYNAITSLVLLPFVNPFIRGIHWLYKGKKK